jgi:hypothetical protein
MNFSYYGGKDIDIKDFMDTSQTMPFFSERRLILVEGSGLFKKSSTEVAEAVDIAPESTYFVFVEDEVDKRNKLFKTISEKGYVCEMKEQKEAELMTWGVRIFAAADKRITKSNMASFEYCLITGITSSAYFLISLQLTPPFGSLHITESYDLVDGVFDRAKAYDYANERLDEILKENPGIKVVIDLHRDGIDENRQT